MRPIVVLAILLGAGYLGLRWFANRMVFLPAMHYPRGFWNVQKELAPAEIWLTTADGVKIDAWWFESSGARLTTLFFHGNGGNLSFYADHVRGILSAGSSLLILDYHGYGKSE